jgi:hypothetical protein
MLIQPKKYALLAGVLLLTLVFGCQHRVKTIPKVELSRTPEITFSLKNDTSGNLRILPAGAPSGGTPINLSPGSGMSLTFYVVRIANLEETGHSWMKPVRGSETSMIISDDPVTYIDIQGEDGLIQMRTDQNQLWTLLLDVESCFGSQNIVEEIIVSQEPDSILPTAVCE